MRHAFALLALLGLAGCPPKYPSCSNDKECRAHEFCVDNKCQQCRANPDCGPDEVCKGGRCEAAPPKRCSDDSACPSGQSCIEGVCKACKSDNHCGEGGKCNAGRCERKPPVVEDPDGANKKPGPCRLETVYFDFNESDMSRDQISVLERNAECLRKAGARAVNLVGHTDARGTEEYNLALSDKRAQAVRMHLTRLGIDGSRLRPVPKGEMDAVGNDEASWLKDRRVDLEW